MTAPLKWQKNNTLERVKSGRYTPLVGALEEATVREEVGLVVVRLVSAEPTPELQRLGALVHLQHVHFALAGVRVEPRRELRRERRVLIRRALAAPDVHARATARAAVQKPTWHLRTRRL